MCLLRLLGYHRQPRPPPECPTDWGGLQGQKGKVDGPPVHHAIFPALHPTPQTLRMAHDTCGLAAMHAVPRSDTCCAAASWVPSESFIFQEEVSLEVTVINLFLEHLPA